MNSRRSLPAIVGAALCAVFMLWLWPVGRAQSTPQVPNEHLSAPQVRSEPFNAPQVPNEHLSAPQVRSERFSASQVRSERFSAPQVRSEPFSASQVRSERFSASRLRLTQNVTATPTPPLPTPDGPMPTPDRLAPPPTADNPTQADEGAQVYWLNCQPCHGDVGQGLTDEWRAQYPEDHQNCWTSGCHGDRPYENGFTLPTYVPPVTGQDSLQKFDHMGLVLSYISAAMPYNAPGSLSQGEYLALAAFLAREHDIWNGQPLRPDTASALRLRPADPPAPTVASPDGGLQEDSAAGQSLSQDETPSQLWLLAIFMIVMAVALGGGLWRWGKRAK